MCFVSKQTCCVSLIQTGCNADASAAADFDLRANGECTRPRLPAQAPQGRRGEAAGGGSEARSWARPLFIHSWFSSLIHMQIKRVEGGGGEEGRAVVGGGVWHHDEYPVFPLMVVGPLAAALARFLQRAALNANRSELRWARWEWGVRTRSLHVTVALAHPPHPSRLFRPPLSYSRLLCVGIFIQRRCGGEWIGKEGEKHWAQLLHKYCCRRRCSIGQQKALNTILCWPCQPRFFFFRTTLLTPLMVPFTATKQWIKSQREFI